MAIIKGNYQNNTLDGGIDDDTIYGYGGNDILNGGGGDNHLFGGFGADTLNGGAGSDYLDGGQGIDVLTGGFGDDTYVVNVSDDVITELPGIKGGVDTVISSVSWTLGAHLENLELSGFNTINGTGNNLANTIIGNTADNVLSGGNGNDFLDGGWGTDILKGGRGNDTLVYHLGDRINGGTGTDTLQVDDPNQSLDLRNITSIKNIEAIKFAENGGGILTLTAQSLLDLSDTSDTLTVEANGDNTLVMDSGWTDEGIISGLQTFTKDGATLLVNPAIGNIEVFTAAYTISDAMSAANVGTAFDSGVQLITIDFGGQHYSDWGLSTIDLSGFGTEDKLMIAQHDGVLSNGTAAYYPSERSNYILEYSSANVFSPTSSADWVSWQAGATKAILGSSSTYLTYSSSVSHSSAQVTLTGLPAGLSDSQFVFV